MFYVFSGSLSELSFLLRAFSQDQESCCRNNDEQECKERRSAISCITGLNDCLSARSCRRGYDLEFDRDRRSVCVGDSHSVNTQCQFVDRLRLQFDRTIRLLFKVFRLDRLIVDRDALDLLGRGRSCRGLRRLLRRSCFRSFRRSILRRLRSGRSRCCRSRTPARRRRRCSRRRRSP